MESVASSPLLGVAMMGHYKFTSWAIHMIMLVLISNAVGIVLREWFLCRRLTQRTLAVALTVLIAAVLLLTYGNYAGGTGNWYPRRWGRERWPLASSSPGKISRAGSHFSSRPIQRAMLARWQMVHAR
jgi:hypothetical protein